MKAPNKKELEYWNEKLKKEGFKDIESSAHYLQKFDSMCFSRQDPEVFFKKREYWLRVSEIQHELNEHSDLEQVIWYLYSLGRSYKRIGATLRLSKSYIHKIIDKIRKEFNL